MAKFVLLSTIGGADLSGFVPLISGSSKKVDGSLVFLTINIRTACPVLFPGLNGLYIPDYLERTGYFPEPIGIQG
jgi:hypothetical protein